MTVILNSIQDPLFVRVPKYQGCRESRPFESLRARVCSPLGAGGAQAAGFALETVILVVGACGNAPVGGASAAPTLPSSATGVHCRQRRLSGEGSTYECQTRLKNKTQHRTETSRFDSLCSSLWDSVISA